MKILCLGDTQLGAGALLAQDRLADQADVLSRIADLADERAVDVVLHCGDVFEHRHPSEEARMVFKQWARRIRSDWARRELSQPQLRGGHPLIVLAGNHCLRNADLVSSVDHYDECEFVRRDAVIDLGDVTLACLPWTPLGKLISARGISDRDVIHEDAANALLGAARDLKADCPPDKPALLALHWWLEGATSANNVGSGVIAEPVIPLFDLEEIGFDAVIAGHVHRAQILREQPPVFYCGSPAVCNFGEETVSHGVWILELGETTTAEFVAIPDRRFVSVTVDLTEEGQVVPGLLDETDVVAAAIAARLPLSDAVVRVKYRATEEQHRRVDDAALEAFLADAGAHKVFGGIQWDAVRASRARVEGMSESLDPAESVSLWCTANEVEESRADALHGLARDWLVAA